MLDAGRPTGYGRRRCNTCRGRVGVRRLPGCRKSAGVAGEAIGHFLNPDQAVDLKDIKVIIDLMKKNSLSEFELEKEGFKIKLKRGGAEVSGRGMSEEFQQAAALLAQSSGALPAPTVSASPPPAPAPKAEDEDAIKSPMIGTFYRAPAPDASPYVEVGEEVNAETVVCIIEAMKVMNEIKAETRGVITEVLVENGKPVGFGQPLFKIRPL